MKKGAAGGGIGGGEGGSQFLSDLRGGWRLALKNLSKTSSIMLGFFFNFVMWIKSHVFLVPRNKI